MALELLNQSKIDRLSSEVGQENVATLLNIFLGELDDYINHLSTEASDDIHEYLKHISHALKSSAASFGADALCGTATAIDSKAKTGVVLDQSVDGQELLAVLQTTYRRYQELSA